MGNAFIQFRTVSKVFPGGVEAVRNLSLGIAEGETLVLLGTSGSGKTTTMKMINRLIEPTSGQIIIDGEDIMVQDPICLRRRIGYSIQSIGLFPHMTVAGNVAVVPRLLKWPGSRIGERVDQLLRMVGLEPDDFRDRYPAQLSGGQRQRVGVARALAADPPIVLMDEPFGALDPITREHLQDEFIELESQIRKTVVFVTHDVFEAVKMGDRIALLDAGQLQQLATPAELVEHPANEFVDQFLGQHRFQLSLLTSTIGAFGEIDAAAPEPANARLRLSARHSMVDALDEFKKSRLVELPVYRRGQYVGLLRKHTLLKTIAKSLGETGEQP
ncbi:MAG TPA: ATP-binding cassette domain-containing protein [Planctomycetota bacterium]|nr:ATP-binding cassette domain-containing protein [Planctomycetota bacterium]